MFVKIQNIFHSLTTVSVYIISLVKDCGISSALAAMDLLDILISQETIFCGHRNGLVQYWGVSIINTLKILESCT